MGRIMKMRFLLWIADWRASALAAIHPMARSSTSPPRRGSGSFSEGQRPGGQRRSPTRRFFTVTSLGPTGQRFFCRRGVFSLWRSRGMLGPLGRKTQRWLRMEKRMVSGPRPDHQGGALRLKNAWAFGPHGVRPACLVGSGRLRFLGPPAVRRPPYGFCEPRLSGLGQNNESSGLLGTLGRIA